jgi:hypothetical protein
MSAIYMVTKVDDVPDEVACEIPFRIMNAEFFHDKADQGGRDKGLRIVGIQFYGNQISFLLGRAEN